MTKRKKATSKTATGEVTTNKRARAVAKGNTKLAQLEAMLRRPEGAAIRQLSKALGWQTHSIRGAMSGLLKKKRELKITSSKVEGSERVYRITE